MSWADMMSQTISYARQGARNAGGDPAWGTPTSARARVEHKSAVILDVDGQEIVLTHRIATLAPLKQGDRITMPDGSTRHVRRVTSAPDLDGAEVLYEVEVG